MHNFILVILEHILFFEEIYFSVILTKTTFQTNESSPLRFRLFSFTYNRLYPYIWNAVLTYIQIFEETFEYVTFLKISFYRKPTLNCFHFTYTNVHKRAKYCVMLYCPLTEGTANVILSPFGVKIIPLWSYDGPLTVSATFLMSSRGSAGVALPLEFRTYFSSVFTGKM